MKLLQERLPWRTLFLPEGRSSPPLALRVRLRAARCHLASTAAVAPSFTVAAAGFIFRQVTARGNTSFCLNPLVNHQDHHSTVVRASSARCEVPGSNPMGSKASPFFLLFSQHCGPRPSATSGATSPSTPSASALRGTRSHPSATPAGWSPGGKPQIWIWNLHRGPCTFPVSHRRPSTHCFLHRSPWTLKIIAEIVKNFTIE